MSKSFTHFCVGNGNCSVIEDDNFVQIIDLNGNEEKSSYELLKPFFRQKNGKDIIDVLVITHGDEDHCKGFSKFKEELDGGNLIIGSIWHQGYDRTKDEKYMKNPSADYLDLNLEIKRRKKIKHPSFGDIQIEPKARDNSNDLFVGISKPIDFDICVLSPFKRDDEDSKYDVNDLSIVLNVNYKGLSMLYTGDSSSKYWQDRIFPKLLDKKKFSNWAKADVLVTSHHGSATFFGPDRITVRDSNPLPDNYEALNKIDADTFVVSAVSKFPLSGDSSGDQPPHYAAWKWYHKWVRENRGISENDKHPSNFKYTSEGNFRWVYKNYRWELKENWSRDPKNLKAAIAGAPKLWGGLTSI